MSTGGRRRAPYGALSTEPGAIEKLKNELTSELKLEAKVSTGGEKESPLWCNGGGFSVSQGWAPGELSPQARSGQGGQQPSGQKVEGQQGGQPSGQQLPEH